MSKNALRVIPLGGLGEVGKNMMALEYGDDIIVIDCGVLFPEEDMPGVDLVIPDVTYLLERRDRVRAIFITHGHEDHTGALPFIVPSLEVPIYAPRLAHGLISVKLNNNRSSRGAELHLAEPGVPISAGVFRVELFRVCHSIPDAMGLAIDTPVGTVVHTGDFKIDHTPVDGQATDLEKLASYGSRGVLLLLSDSTYAELPGYTPSERVVGDALERTIGDAQGRVPGGHLRLPHIPDPAGHRRGGPPRPEGGHRGAEHGGEREDEHGDGVPVRSSGRPAPTGRDPSPGRGRHRPDNHRQPGRAHLGPGQDSQPGPQGHPGDTGGHGDNLGHSHPRQRDGDHQDHRQPLQAGGPGAVRPRRPGARPRPRRPGRAEDNAQPHQAAPLRPHPRRVPPPGDPLLPGRGDGSAQGPHLRPGRRRRAGAHRRGRRGRGDRPRGPHLRGRQVTEDRRQPRAQGPASPVPGRRPRSRPGPGQGHRNPHSPAPGGIPGVRRRGGDPRAHR